MPETIRSVIIPSEIQAREFDGKLLLACFLAEQGLEVIVGARHEIHAALHEFPRSLYVAKDFRKPSVRIFDILEYLGHPIVAWEEEGLLTFRPETYHVRRVHAQAISKVREFYAWGAPGGKLIETAPGYPGTPVHITGNPRIDLLRSELREFYAAEAEKLNEEFGEFILINSNFGVTNHVMKSQVTLPGQPDPLRGDIPGDELNIFLRHRVEMFGRFQELLPKLADRFPDRQVVLRPHPAEGSNAWEHAAGGRKNITVIHRGEVAPWLLAAKVMVHNGCSTGLESYLLGRPPIAYLPKDVDPSGGPPIADDLSYQADTQPALFDLIAECLERDHPLDQTSDRQEKLTALLAASDGPLASARIADHILALLEKLNARKSPSTSRFKGQVKSRWRSVQKTVNANRPGHKSSNTHNLHRYPGLSLVEVNKRIKAFSHALSRFSQVQADPVKGQIYRISAAGTEVAR